MHYPPLKLVNRRVRDRAKVIIDSAPDGWIVAVKPPKRTNPQNDKMWAMIEDIRRAEPMGWKYDKDDWKLILMKSCGEEVRALPDTDGRLFPACFRSSKLTVDQMSKMIEFMYAFGAEKGVVFREPEPEEMR